MTENIIIKGARANNLKNIDIVIPRNKMIVLTGLSGSGKTSLAFDTIYAEGQRRYVESLSSYARQFLGQMDKPDVDYIEGLSPAISIDQKTTGRNPRSTVGTVTEIHDYLRLLYARVGHPHCPKCGKPIEQQTIDQMTDWVLKLPIGERVQIMAPVVRSRKGEYHKLLEDMLKKGYTRARVDGNLYDISEEQVSLDKNLKHSIEIVVDRVIIKEGIQTRIADSLEAALKLADGLALVVTSEKEKLFSQNYACVDCGISIQELEPRSFSFNNPFGACPECTGLGVKNKISPDMVISDPNKSLAQGAIKASGWNNTQDDSIAMATYKALAEHYHFDIDTPVCELDKSIVDIIMYGTREEKIEYSIETAFHTRRYKQSFEGVINNMERRYRETSSDFIKQEIEQYMVQEPCPVCKGRRLKPEVLSVLVGGLNISELSDKSVRDALEFLDSINLTEKEEMIADRILKEIRGRLQFLSDVGLSYLTLSRGAATLSGGEAQRIRLATQIGAGLMGVLYILDEPSIGLHQRDNGKLLASLKNLRDIGNTLIVVEHDEETMLEADYLVDIGPGAGVHGGYVVAAGTPKEVMKNKNSLTGQYLSGKKRIPIPKKRRAPDHRAIRIKGAAQNNLRDIDVTFPIGLFTVVTGVSGSGKSSLVNSVLYKNVARMLNGTKVLGGKCRRIEGIEHIDKIVVIDQSPIGRTPRSNPATYTGVFDLIRNLFAQTQDAKTRGYNNGRFSFNVKGGRCEACSGDGLIKIEMHFMADIFVPCEVCKGKRYNRETLEVRYKGKNIHDVLEMTAEEAYDFFKNIPQIEAKLKTLNDVGLGYVKLGQPSTTLSGGEAQRIKLATELSKRSTGKTLYILDEPTTGLHTHDVAKLINILNRLTDEGNTVVVIEHNLDVIKSADYCIDLGPEGGDGGGCVVATGTPEEVSEVSGSYTGQYLARVLSRK
ncbi:MAG: excinuclease ABC subunit UvrA [Clostridia bacterium]|nr:excinuclease ABC subunit UvrA [Clostridia bacterium]